MISQHLAFDQITSWNKVGRLDEMITPGLSYQIGWRAMAYESGLESKVML